MAHGLKVGLFRVACYNAVLLNTGPEAAVGVKMECREGVCFDMARAPKARIPANHSWLSFFLLYSLNRAPRFTSLKGSHTRILNIGQPAGSAISNTDNG